MARKYPEKYGPLLVLDAGLITVFTAIVVVFMWGIIDSVDLFNPFDDYIDNFDYSDLVYSEMSRKDDIYTTDTNIYIVNIGDLSRGELAEKINIIEKFDPKVIGIDAVFREPKTGNLQEIMERRCFSRRAELVLITIPLRGSSEQEASILPRSSSTMHMRQAP